ncbi:hypothetical protein EDI_308750 [Entamoeba dispar SAW760]|uniref:Uncharacterized protein n=1 Tax=Entamoeba dispar (strain ATCC PRA-260 / SAW760) TaxID=370354 RepID=B0EP04_ENTDS|nr:uncharacterized protein EDI_308750 [Entamoeba dispar SAW760]EDR23743.1 hypothetical protein EDI_308750 [Entamoeba dispar SAW760]|eukprot:EDR23743.1 hypothetical protein EDI_308750 [Entamoeba dispar SAW760]
MFFLLISVNILCGVLSEINSFGIYYNHDINIDYQDYTDTPEYLEELITVLKDMFRITQKDFTKVFLDMLKCLAKNSEVPREIREVLSVIIEIKGLLNDLFNTYIIGKQLFVGVDYSQIKLLKDKLKKSLISVIKRINRFKKLMNVKKSDENKYTKMVSSYL